MKNTIIKADKKSSSSKLQYSMFIGRWQPLHDGHKWLFQQVLDEGKNVCIGIRDVETDINNPYSTIDILFNIQNHYQDLIDKGVVKVIIVPDIESICFGRGVGYDIVEYQPPQEISNISATKIREANK